MKKLASLISAAIVASTAISSIQAQEELIYVAVEPCRIADTRQSAEGVIKANTFRNFLVAGTSEELAVQGGTADCLNPKAASGTKPAAIAAYIIAVPATSSTSQGVLTAYPSDQPPPPAGSGSTVNFAKDQTIGNTNIATLCAADEGCPAGGELAILSRNTDEHVVVDVQGYFYPGPDDGYKIVLDETVTTPDSGRLFLNTLCPEGKRATGGGYWFTPDTNPIIQASRPWREGDGWQVTAVASEAGFIEVYAVCENR
jgi:hypothetical protein